MNALFSPCKLGPLSLKNPFVFLPFFVSYADAKGMVTNTQIRHYKRMAASGVGLVVVEAAGLRHSAAPFAIHAYASEHLPGLKQLVDASIPKAPKPYSRSVTPDDFPLFPVVWHPLPSPLSVIRT